MPFDFGILPYTDHILPELLAMPRTPTVVTLKNGDDELPRAFEQIGYVGIFCFHLPSSVILSLRLNQPQEEKKIFQCFVKSPNGLPAADRSIPNQ
jgi:hypothetical protein